MSVDCPRSVESLEKMDKKPGLSANTVKATVASVFNPFFLDSQRSMDSLQT